MQVCPKYTIQPNRMMKGTYTLTISFKISLSLPFKAMAPTAMAILWGEIILPAQVPAELAAASQVLSALMATAASVCKFPNSTLLEVPEPVMKVPTEPMRGAINGYIMPVASTAVRAISEVIPLYPMTLAVAITAMIVIMVLRKPITVLLNTQNISPKPEDWILPLIIAAKKIKIPGVAIQTKV